jgi:hypothetical protein
VRNFIPWLWKGELAKGLTIFPYLLAQEMAGHTLEKSD